MIETFSHGARQCYQNDPSSDPACRDWPLAGTYHRPHCPSVQRCYPPKRRSKCSGRIRCATELSGFAAFLPSCRLAAISMAGQTPAPPPNPKLKSIALNPPAKSAERSRSRPSDTLGRPGSARHLVRAGRRASGTLRRQCRQGIPDRRGSGRLGQRKGLDPGRNARSAHGAQDVSGAYNAVFNSS